jgi:hypothetical protein
MGFSISIPIAGQPDATEDPKIASSLTTLANWGNGNIDPADVKAAFAQSAGMNQSGQTVKGSSIIATSQSTGSTTYTTLGTPDQVAGIVLPTTGLIMVLFQARMQNSVASAGSAAIFIGANQLKSAQGTSAAAESCIVNDTNTRAISSCSYGLQSDNLGGPYSGDVTTGQAITTNGFGGPCYIFAAAGTYTVSVQVKASSGTVTLDNRRLYVQAVSFA